MSNFRRATVLIGLSVAAMSPTRMTSDVSRGEIARLSAAWADCSRSVIPDLDRDISMMQLQSSRWGLQTSGDELLESLAIRSDTTRALSGSELSSTNEEDALLRLGDASGSVGFWAERGSEGSAGGPSSGGPSDDTPKTESFESSSSEQRHDDVFYDAATGSTVAVTSIAGATGCTRVVLSSDRNLQVGLRKSRVSGLRGIVLGWSAVKPIDHRGNALVRVYKDGRPEQDAKIRLWVERIGQFTVPGIDGAGFGHDHIATNISAAPSLRLLLLPMGEKDTIRVLNAGQQIETKTDGTGEFSFGIQAGHRGGVERLVVALVGRTGPETKSAISIAARHGKLRHWSIALNQGRSTPSLQYPFLLVGQTSAHSLTHYVEPTVLYTMYNALLDLWKQDLSTQERTRSLYTIAGYPKIPNDTLTPKAKWLQLGDMSLEYGGKFSVAGEAGCADTLTGTHANHDAGVEFDLIPCYTLDNGGPLSGPGCSTPNASAGIRPVKFSLVEAIFARQLGAVVYAHSTAGTDPRAERNSSTTAAYHIRVPFADGMMPLLNTR